MEAKDIENAFFTLMSQLIHKLDPVFKMPDDAAKALKRCAEARSDVIKELGLPAAEGKKVLLEVINGGGPPSRLSEHDVIVGLRKAAIWIKWLAISNFPDLYSHCDADRSKPSPDNSMIAYLYQAVEDLVLSSWVQFLMTQDLVHLSLHFDGCRIQGRALDTASMCQESSEWIAKETGFQVVVKQKKHLLLAELLGRDGRVCDTLSLSSSFDYSANGILTCLAYIADLWSPLDAWLQEHKLRQTLKEVKHIVHIKNVSKLQMLPSQ